MLTKASRLLDNGAEGSAGLPSLWNPLTLRRLSRQQKRLDQLALAAHGHPGKALVPLTVGHVGLCVEPRREQFELRCRDLPTLDAFEQMLTLLGGGDTAQRIY